MPLVSLFYSSLRFPNSSPLTVAGAPHAHHTFRVRSDSSTKAPHASHQFSNPRPIEAHAPPSHLECPLLPPTPTQILPWRILLYTEQEGCRVVISKPKSDPSFGNSSSPTSQHKTVFLQPPYQKLESTCITSRGRLFHVTPRSSHAFSNGYDAPSPFSFSRDRPKSHTAATRKRLHHNRDHHQLQTRAGVCFSNSNVANYK